jgi:undecaprenyl-diphosphatase
MDRTISLLAQKIFQHHTKLLRVTCIAKFGYWLYILYGLVEWCRPGTWQQRLQRRHRLLYCIAAVAFGSTISFVLGRFWKRERPFVTHRDIRDILPHKANASFPSNHSMNSMAASTMMLHFHNWWGLPFFCWSLVIGASRIACGLHYASDVLGGFAMGAVSTGIIRNSAAARKGIYRISWVGHVLSEIIRIGRKV